MVVWLTYHWLGECQDFVDRQDGAKRSGDWLLDVYAV
jgi:hypothetical protein